ncbi:MAG: HlyD family secretion protein [Cytophagales bacterium]|nr:HlyD family secretion protein [Cytophagales bacterium]
MPDIQNRHLEAFSEEVQEIMGHVPRWIVRWGITVFFLIFMSILAGSYFFKYPRVVSTPFVLTTINPPVPIVCKTNGRIAKWYVSDGDRVREKTVVALLDNSVNYDDLNRLNKLLSGMDRDWIDHVGSIDLPEKLSLGQLQHAYLGFRKLYDELRTSLDQDLTGKKITILESRISNREEQNKLLLRQWDLKQEEYRIAERIFVRDSTAYHEGGYGIIKTEYERSLQTIISDRSSLLSFESSVKNAELTLLQLRESLLELRMSKENELNKLKDQLDEAYVRLQTQIADWTGTFVLTSPIEGKITLTNYWSENQVINSGERLATIIPHKETIIIARAYVPSSGLGKVAAGQEVNIKLSGFPYMEYGILKGKVNTISEVPEASGYVAEIELVKGMESAYGEKLRFIQHMDGTADIITEETRLVYRFINPLRMILNNIHL